jgi:hypothetical protein
MPKCTEITDPKIIAQTIFLGASVSSFNSTMGWSGQSSQLTVNLVSDDAGSPCKTNAQFNSLSFNDNHYHECSGDSCYVDRDGSTWNENNVGTLRADNSVIQSEDKMVPGKVYYNLDVTGTDTLPIKSKYYINPDPGFLGVSNRIASDGTASNVEDPTNTGYDIIGTPVYFKMGNFTFGGIIQTWSEDFSSGGKQYRVQIDGMHSVLKDCYIIISKYGGAVYSKYNDSSSYGSPRNYVGNGPIYSGTISQGNIPNVFNVYGFLESTAPENFGGADCNDDGMCAVDIIDSLSVLTSRISGSNLKDRANTTNDQFGPKTAYSPFGRILVKSMQTYNGTQIDPAFTSWGVIPPQANNEDGSNKCEFLLDLSELPRPPREFRIQGIKISILEFINLVTEACGYDYNLELMPVVYSGRIYNVIKLKTISRLKQPIVNQIQSTVNQLYCDGYQITSSAVGKEKNDSPARVMIVGGPQQRLYQVKSYRLAYTQSNYILMDGKFIHYGKLGQYTYTVNNPPPGGTITNIGATTNNFGYGKIRTPAMASQRNPTLSALINPDISALFADDENIKSTITGATFVATDSAWNDGKEIGNGGVDIRVGNYDTAKEFKYTMSNDWGQNRTRDGSASTRDTKYGKNKKPLLQRYIPLWKDLICPFFGYIMDNTLSVDTDRQTLNARDFRRARPVFYDTWTGQICVVFRASELPSTRLDLRGLYGGYSLSERQGKIWTWRTKTDASGNPTTPTPSTDTKEWFFLVTESEIRAAMAGPDNFLAYSTTRQYKTDLYLMMNQAHFSYKYELRQAMSDPDAANNALTDCDWSWNPMAANTANPVGAPGTASNGRPSGPGGYIEETVRQDFAILSSFISKIGESFYGKKYMVYAPYLGARKDEDYSTSFSIPVNAPGAANGTAYVFGGGPSITYNYTPTRDGAWEEPGNIIDDTIVIGSQDSFNLSDDRGLIGTILGYNASDSYDMARYKICQKTLTELNINNTGAHPVFNFGTWKQIKAAKAKSCNQSDFIFPSVDISTLPDSNSYVVKTLNTSALDAFGESTGQLRKKLYIKAEIISEKFIFLNPEQLSEPRILVQAPRAIELNSSSIQYQKDPNRTVMSTAAMEDLAIYLRVNDPNKWDNNIIHLLTQRISDVYAQFPGFGPGPVNALATNTNSQNISIKSKAMHPFFAAIPIKSHQYNYGPWINYPALETITDDIFPGGNNVKLNYNSNGTTSCSNVAVSINATNALNNWILPTQIEYKPEEFVPWNYGSMSFLDKAAYKEVKTQINYQSVIETANVEMPGLPIFNIGGSFSTASINNIAPINSPIPVAFTYKEVKRITQPYSSTSNLPEFTNLSNNTISNQYNTSTLTYNVIKIKYKDPFLAGPIITHINVDVGRGGIRSSYSFRTYTRKLALFNKESNDKFKKIFKENLARDKKLSRLSQQLQNKSNIDALQLMEQDRKGAKETSNSSLLPGTSPVEIITASAFPFLKEPIRTPKYIDERNSQTTPTESETATYSLPGGNDLGTGDLANNLFSDASYQIASMKHRSRTETSANIFQLTEIHDFLQQDYGRKSAMSLDGIFSPVSFYPTDGSNTYSFSKYEVATCPICNGERKRDVTYKYFKTGSVTESTGTYSVLCNGCAPLGDKLHSKLYNNKTTFKNYSEVLPPYILTDKSDANALSNMNSMVLSSSRGEVSAPINLVSLQPIIVPYSEFRNPNIQNYTGEHPDKAHVALKVNGQDRSFIDRGRHSISIVARSAAKPSQLALNNKIDNNETLVNNYNPDFYYRDLEGNKQIKSIDSSNYASLNAEMNQRFVGFRGPLVVHGWGYDKEGYPVPNAADEPYEIDNYGRPKRFSLSETVGTETVKYKDLAIGEVFSYNSSKLVKAKNLAMQDTPGYRASDFVSLAITDDTDVYKVTYKDDLSSSGGFDPATYQGSIIGKTQKYVNGYWSSKVKLNEFHLNWGEHPELWPVGPIDLRWDSNRKVWTANQDPVYKMVYVTLEEDLIKANDLDETYPSRGFLDDIEYSTLPLDNSYRRVVFVKDRAGYTAPRGAKLLCRYDAESGFYEPVSKPSFIVMGTLNSSGSAVITMSYVLGKKKGEDAPTMEVSFDNPLDFNIGVDGGKGLLTFVSGKWILSAIK